MTWSEEGAGSLSFLRNRFIEPHQTDQAQRYEA
jgi:hypothetical protein